MRHIRYLSIALVSAVLSMGSASAKEPRIYLFEAVQTDAALADDFKRVMQSIIETSPWVASYGTSFPSVLETVDNKTYRVFHACEPRNCTAENYTIMYDEHAKKIVAGTFVRTRYEGPALIESRIEWLEKPGYDMAIAMSKFLF